MAVAVGGRHRHDGARLDAPSPTRRSSRHGSSPRPAARQLEAEGAGRCATGLDARRVSAPARVVGAAAASNASQWKRAPAPRSAVARKWACDWTSVSTGRAAPAAGGQRSEAKEVLVTCYCHYWLLTGYAGTKIVDPSRGNLFAKGMIFTEPVVGANVLIFVSCFGVSSINGYAYRSYLPPRDGTSPLR